MLDADARSARIRETWRSNQGVAERSVLSASGSTEGTTWREPGLVGPVRRANRPGLLARELASALHIAARMTRFDRTWEPLLVLFAAAVLLIGTL